MDNDLIGTEQQLPVAVNIMYSSMWNIAPTVAFLFADYAAANETFGKLSDAAKAYEARTNDREKLITFDHLTGSATVDISNIVSVAIDDPMGPGRAALEAWNRECVKVKAGGPTPPGEQP